MCVYVRVCVCKYIYIYTNIYFNLSIYMYAPHFFSLYAFIIVMIISLILYLCL